MTLALLENLVERSNYFKFRLRNYRLGGFWQRLLIHSRRLLLSRFTFFYLKGFSVAFYCLQLLQSYFIFCFYQVPYDLLISLLVKHNLLPCRRRDYRHTPVRGYLMYSLPTSTGFSCSRPLLFLVTILPRRCHQLLSISVSNGMMKFFLFYTAAAFFKQVDVLNLVLKCTRTIGSNYVKWYILHCFQI